MILLNTKFHCVGITRQILFDYICQYLRKSSMPDISADSFDFETQETMSFESEQHDVLTVDNYPDVCIMTYITHGDKGSVYTTDYVLNDTAGSSSLYLRQTKSFLSANAYNDSDFELVHVPDPIQSVFWNEYGGDDNGLPTDNQPLMLKKSDVRRVKAIFSDISGFSNPIVYVSPVQETGEYKIDINKVARALQGQAHVLVESSPVASEEIAKYTEHANPYNGSIRIYTSDGGQETLLCGGAGADVNLVMKVRKMLSHVAPDEYCDPDKIRQKYVFAKFSDSKLAEQCENLLRDRDEEINRLRSENEELKSAMFSAQNKAESLQNNLDSKISSDGLFLRFELTEKDLYDGETAAVVLKVLRKELDSMKDDPNLSKSRKFDVLSDILDHNFPCTTDADLVKCIRSAFSDGVLTKEGIGCLRASGFDVEKGDRKAHYKVTFNGDERYVAMFSSTPSDKRRGTKNCISDFVNVLFGY